MLHQSYTCIYNYTILERKLNTIQLVWTLQILFYDLDVISGSIKTGNPHHKVKERTPWSTVGPGTTQVWTRGGFFHLTHDVQTYVVKGSNPPTAAVGGFSTVQQVDTRPPRCSRINYTLDSPALTGPWWIWVLAVILSTIKKTKCPLRELPDCAGFHIVFRLRASFFRRFSPLWSWVDLKAEESREFCNLVGVLVEGCVPWDQWQWLSLASVSNEYHSSLPSLPTAINSLHQPSSNTATSHRPWETEGTLAE